jgi:hypothetical protein
MVRAWWLGEFVGSAPPRLEFLKKMFAKRNDHNELNEIVFVIEGEVQQPTTKELSDGITVDIRPRIPVPSVMTDEWDEVQCDAAFREFGSDEMSILEHYPDWCVVFLWFELSRTEWVNWLRSRGYSLPCFWGGLKEDTVQTYARGKKGPKPGELRRYEAEDRALFPQIEKIIKEENKSPSAAAKALAEAGKIKGTGSPDSRAKRVVSLYNLERTKRTTSESR